MNEKLTEAMQFLADTYGQFARAEIGDDEKYWQGRKDGARLMFAILTDDAYWRDSLNDVVRTSPNSRMFDYQLANALLADAVYAVAAALYELREMKKLDVRTRLNLESFIGDYTFLAGQGKFPVIDDHCLS